MIRSSPSSGISRSLLVAVMVATFLLSSVVAGDREDVDYYFLEVAYPVSSETAEYINEHFFIEGFRPRSEYILAVPPSRVAELRDLSFVVDVRPYSSEMHYSADLVGRDSVDVVLSLFDTANADAVLSNLRELDVEPTEMYSSLIPVVNYDILATVPGSLIPTLAQVHGVKLIEEHPDFIVFNDVGTVLTGARQADNDFNLHGENQRITITDTGLDVGVISSLMHDDFEGRIYNFKNYRGTSPDDLQGHGTHVTGIALGNGKLSGSNPFTHQYDGSYAGVAPEATVYVQAISSDDPFDPFVYPPSESVTLQDSYNNGVRIHSHSYGSTLPSTFSTYTGSTQQVDDHIWRFKDYVAIYGAGNYGLVYGSGTIDTNAAAKNAIAVGGSENVKPTLSDPPIVADNADEIYLGTSLGPVEDGRIKPDIMAPATTIFSPRSHVATGTLCTKNETAAVNLGPDYADCGGTSMAAPHVAGLVALLRQNYMASGIPLPTAALLKASIIASGQEMLYGYPSMTSGWGRANITTVLPSTGKVVWYDDETAGVVTGQTYATTLPRVQGGAQLKVVLVWTDFYGTPGVLPHLVNDLDLEVISPGGIVFHGNDFAVPYDDTTDRLNNVEVIRVPAPQSGTYTVKVKGFSVPVLDTQSQSQPFAVVALYDLQTPSTTSGGTRHRGNMSGNCTYSHGVLTC